MTSQPRILVVGDVILDRYVQCRVDRMSPEAPVPIAVPIGETVKPGGAAFVATQLAALGAEVTLMTAWPLGDDGYTLSRLTAPGVHRRFGWMSETGTTKTRYVTDDWRQLLRIDSDADPSRVEAARSSHKFDPGEHISGGEYGVVLISDYGKGVVSDFVAKAVMAACRRKGIPVVVNSKRSDPEVFRGATLLTVNLAELASLSDDRHLAASSQAINLKERTNVRNLLVTMGGAGALFVDWKLDPVRLRAVARAAEDVTGAGDVVAAVAAHWIAQGFPVEHACTVAMRAASASVGKRGCTPVTPDEFEDEAKLESETKLESEVVGEASPAPKFSGFSGDVVFTNGCFDILHAGHRALLEYARSLGGHLVVGLNTDGSVRELKGEGRPVNSYVDRVQALRNLGIVDQIFPVSGENGLLRLIESISPDVLVKGGDYEGKEIVGADHVRSTGGRVGLFPLVDGLSTTRIVEESWRGENPPDGSAK